MSKWSEVEDAFLLKSYNSLPKNEIADRLPQRTWAAIKRRAFLIGANNKLDGFNEDFFCEVNNVSAYWAGFIAADGCIVKNGRTLQIGVSTVDVEHLRLFIATVGARREPNFYKYKEGWNCASTSFTSDIMSNTLLDIYGIGPRKTRTYGFPKLNDTEHQRAFIVGLIDGDGSFFRDKRDDSLKFSLAGTEETCSGVRDFLSIDLKKKIEKHSTADCFYYRHSGTNAEKLRDMLMGIQDVPYLDRKWTR